MARTISVPQRAGALADPMIYEALSRIVAGVNLALTVQMAPSQPVTPSGVLVPTNPVTRLLSGGAVRTIGSVDFDCPLFLIAAAGDVQLETGGNIGSAQTVSDGTACALVLDKTTGIWWPVASDIPGITAAGRALLDDVDAAAQRATLGLGTAAVMTPVAIRKLPTVSVTTSRNVASTDAGALLIISGSGALTFDNTNGCAVGDQIMVLKGTAGSSTITQGTGVSLYASGNNVAGDRVLAQYSICTFIQHAAGYWVGWGAGLV